MKKFFTSVFLLIALCASAQVQVLRSGAQNMLIRVQSQVACLLLPVSEQAPESSMRVLVNNQCVQTLSIRLATRGEVNYYVPFSLENYDVNQLLLNVCLPDSTLIRQINWEAVQTAASFPFVTADTFRPVFHHAPQYGWMGGACRFVLQC